MHPSIDTPERKAVASPLRCLSLEGMFQEAMMNLSSLPPESILVMGSAAMAPLLSSAGDAQGMFGDGLHAHRFFEIGYVVDGGCRVWMQNGWLDLKRGQIIVVPPHCVHSEGWITQDSSYRLLWFVASGDTMQAFADTYDALEGWSMSGFVCLQDAGVSFLHEATTRSHHKTRKRQEPDSRCFLLKGYLLTLLARMHCVATEGCPPGAGSLSKEALVPAVRSYLDLNFAQALSVSAVASRFGRSTNYLNRVFSREVGMGIHTYIVKRRLDAAIRLLAKQTMLVKEVALAVGFTDPLYFCRQFRQHYGYPPSEAADHALVATEADV